MNKGKLIVALLAAVGLAALVWYLLRPDPQTVIHQAQMKLVAEKTVKYDVDLRAIGDLAASGLSTESGGEASSLRAEVSSALDRSNPLQPASFSTFSVTVSATGSERVLSGEARRKARVHYLKLDSATVLEQKDAERVVGKWIKSPSPFIRLIFPSKNDNAGFSVDAAGMTDLMTSVSKVNVFTATGVLPSEKIGGAATYHYKVALNRDAAIALLLKWKELTSGQPVTADDLDAATAEVQSWGVPVGEIWIGRSDRRVRKIALVTQLSPQAGNTQIWATVAFTGYGQTVKVDVPEAETLDEIMGAAAEGQLKPAGGRVAEARGETSPQPKGLAAATSTAAADKDSDGDGLTDSQEFFYGSDAWNPDTDADGYSDGWEVKHGLSPTGPGQLFGFGL